MRTARPRAYGLRTRPHLEELLRRLALNDENAVRRAVGADRTGPSVPPALDARTQALVRLAALLAVGAATSSCRATVDVARAAGVRDEEIVAVLMAIAPAIGGAQLVAAAPALALAIDIDVESVDDALP